MGNEGATKPGTPRATTLLTPRATTPEIPRGTTPGTSDLSYTPIKMNIFSPGIDIGSLYSSLSGNQVV